MIILNFKVRKFNCAFPRRKWLKNFLKETASPPLRNLVIFSKKMWQKQWFQIQKHEKYLKSKNDIKRRLGAFKQELWANFEFENSEISELFPPGKTARYWWKRDSQHFRNVEKFSLWCVPYILRYIIYVT